MSFPETHERLLEKAMNKGGDEFARLFAQSARAYRRKMRAVRRR